MNRSWFPTISADLCNGCKGEFKCVAFCPNDVLEINGGKALVVKPLDCIFGCSNCAKICPKKAIIFPQRETTYKNEKKKTWLHKIVCRGCGKNFSTDRETELCFECEHSRLIT